MIQKPPTPKQQIRELAREWSHDAFMEIVALMRMPIESAQIIEMDANGDPVITGMDTRILALKLEASKYICDQAYGKAPMSIDITGNATQYVMYMPAPVKDTTEWLNQAKPKLLQQ